MLRAIVLPYGVRKVALEKLLARMSTPKKKGGGAKTRLGQELNVSRTEKVERV